MHELKSNFKKSEVILDIIATLLISSVVFFLFFFFDKSIFATFQGNKDVLKNIDINISSVNAVREYLDRLTLRIISIMVPVIMAVATFILSRYTETHFNLIMRTIRVASVFYWYLAYLTFRILLTFFSESITSFKFISTLYVDGLFMVVILITSIYTVFKLFIYAQPKKLSSTFLDKIEATIHRLNSKIFSMKSKQDQVSFQIQKLKQLVTLFINISVIAIQGKDYNTIKESLENLSKLLWDDLIDRDDTKQRKPLYHFFLNFRIDLYMFRVNLLKRTLRVISSLNSQVEKPVLVKSFFSYLKEYFFSAYQYRLNHIGEIEIRRDNYIKRTREDSDNAVELIMMDIEKYYEEVYKAAFDKKEFRGCEIILEHLHNIALTRYNRKPVSRVYNIFVQIFATTVNHDYKGYTDDFGKRIINIISEIYLKEEHNQDIKVYFSLLKICLVQNQVNLMKYLLFSLFKVFKEPSVDNKYSFYSLICDTGIYSLQIKSMECFGEYIRYLVTKGLNIKELNQLFKYIDESNVMDSKDSIEDELEILEVTHEEETPIFDIEPSNFNYLLLKLYVVFYSYYKLQTRISNDRIDQKYINLSVNHNYKNNISFDKVRTLLLDFETHSEHWNLIFVNQSELYFTQTAFEILKINDRKYVQFEIKNFGNTEFLNSLLNKIVD